MEGYSREVAVFDRMRMPWIRRTDSMSSICLNQALRMPSHRFRHPNLGMVESFPSRHQGHRCQVLESLPSPVAERFRCSMSQIPERRFWLRRRRRLAAAAVYSSRTSSLSGGWCGRPAALRPEHSIQSAPSRRVPDTEPGGRRGRCRRTGLRRCRQRVVDENGRRPQGEEVLILKQVQ